MRLGRPAVRPVRVRATSLTGAPLERSHREPPWWVRDILVAAALGLLLLWFQASIDRRADERAMGVEEKRATQEAILEDERAANAERLENLRFVRERSARDAIKPFQSIDLTSMPLRGLDLTHADFEAAQLESADLTGTDLAHASLHNASLQRATAVEADLTGAEMYNSSFADADLSYAKFGCKLTDARILRRPEVRCGLAEGLNLRGANLTGALVFRMSFSHSIADGATLAKVHLIGSTINYSDYRQTNFELARVEDTFLSDVDLTGSDWTDARKHRRGCRRGSGHHARLD